ncbi:MAG: cytochrome c biogenesis heme-transporting ATPase CcmA [Methylophilaceae bacterium]
MLSVSNLQCVRGERILFQNISFHLEKGRLLYIEGANGSGKTTLLRTVCGLFQSNQGQVRWNNQDIQSLAEDYLGQVLYIGHLAGIKEDLTAVENLQFSASLTGNMVSRDQVVAALTALDIARCADLTTRILSQGQKRRVALARLWLEDNPLWVLDEPFTALDVSTIQLITGQIETFVNNGGIVIFTSHQLPNFDPRIMQHIRLD